MRTGIKTFTRRAMYRVKNTHALHRGIIPHIFPEEPAQKDLVQVRLRKLQSELRMRKIEYNLGSLYTLPHSKATQAYKQFIDYNPGNLGSWSDDASVTYTTTTFEYEVIHKMIDLYHGNHRALGGYITSGGTEGNIYALWLGRSYLEQWCEISRISLLTASLTHYSISKAARLCNISEHYIPLNKHTWNIDVTSFESTARSLYAKGYRGFIVPLTLGYTSTGTSDDVDGITKAATACERALPGVKFYFWIDAAYNGLIYPFLSKEFKPFASPYVHAFVVDFQKLGLVPYPAGVVLYRRKLRVLVEKPIDYLEEIDATLLGSRSGIPAISIWMMIHSFGKSGYRKMIMRQTSNKEYLIQKLKSLRRHVEIIVEQDSLSLGVIFHDLKNNRLPVWIEEKYSLYLGHLMVLFAPYERKEIRIYKIFFLPHLKRRVVSEFMRDVDSIR